MNDSTKGGATGIEFSGLLAIVFIALKLTHVIAWSWWWVLCPLWAGLAVYLVCLLVVLVLKLLER